MAPSRIRVRLVFAPLCPPHLRGSPSPSGIKLCHEIIETVGYHRCKPEVSISLHLVLEQYRVVKPKQTDRKTDEWTDRQNYHS